MAIFRDYTSVSIFFVVWKCKDVERAHIFRFCKEFNKSDLLVRVCSNRIHNTFRSTALQLFSVVDDLSGWRSQHQCFFHQWYVVSYLWLSDAIRAPTVSDLHVSAALSVTATGGSSEGQGWGWGGGGVRSIRLLSKGRDRHPVIQRLDDRVSVPTGLLTLTPTWHHRWSVQESGM